MGLTLTSLSVGGAGVRQGLTLTSLSVGGAGVRQGLMPLGRVPEAWASTGHREGGAGPHAGCWEAGRDLALRGCRGVKSWAWRGPWEARAGTCIGCSPTIAGPVQATGRQELGPKNLAGESSGPTKAVGSWAGVEPKELAYLLGGTAGRCQLQDNLGLQRSPGGPSLAWRSPPTGDHLGPADAIGGQELILERPP